MTIKELEKLRLGLWDGSMKRKVVIEWRLGLLKYKEIVVTLKIKRREFRQWVRWEYYHRVYKYKNVIDMSKETDVRKLQERVKELERKLEDEQLRTQALNILIDIGEEKYGMELRKKSGTNQLKK
jgi:DNA-binding transcriptional regulator YdaS (Cro superfamily)